MFRWFNNLKMRSKLTLAFLVMIGLTAVVSAVALVSQNNAQTTVDQLLDVDVRKAELHFSRAAAANEANVEAARELRLLESRGPGSLLSGLFGKKKD